MGQITRPFKIYNIQLISTLADKSSYTFTTHLEKKEEGILHDVSWTIYTVYFAYMLLNKKRLCLYHQRKNRFVTPNKIVAYLVTLNSSFFGRAT